MHWRRKWQPTPVFLPGESQGRRACGQRSMGPHRVGHDWSDLAAAAPAVTFMNGFLQYLMLSYFSRVGLFATLWTVACQTPLSVGFSKQEYWSGLPFPSPPIFDRLPKRGIALKEKVFFTPRNNKNHNVRAKQLVSAWHTGRRKEETKRSLTSPFRKLSPKPHPMTSAYISLVRTGTYVFIPSYKEGWEGDSFTLGTLPL